LFPQYEFRELSQNHVIFTGQQFPSRRWRIKPHVLGLSNDVRELMLLPSEDISRALQASAEQIRHEQYELLDDIVLYALDKTKLEAKGNSIIVEQDASKPVQRTVKLARLQYAGNWDPEPGGWTRLAAILHNQFKTALMVEPVKLGQGKLLEQNFAHMTGTTAFSLDDRQREDLRQFIKSGGTLIVDAAGGSQEFTASARKELLAVFGPGAAKALQTPLTLDNPLFTAPGVNIDSIGYRAFARASLVGELKSPRLCALRQGGRVVCYFSPEDLSAGLVGEPIDGIVGYDPETATKIMRNILLRAR
jgi:hypothetical protein